MANPTIRARCPKQLTRFRAAYSSGSYRARGRADQERVASQVVPWSASRVAPVEPLEPVEIEEEPEETGETLLSVAVDRMRHAGPPAHQVWLPPLDLPPTLDQILPPLEPHDTLGLTTVESDLRGALTIPVGIVDRPFEQIRDLLVIDVSGAGGHVAIAGGPQSGKSTLLRTLISGLALTHSPREVQFYCLDFGGGSLSAIAELPHVGGVTGRRRVGDGGLVVAGDGRRGRRSMHRRRERVRLAGVDARSLLGRLDRRRGGRRRGRGGRGGGGFSGGFSGGFRRFLFLRTSG